MPSPVHLAAAISHRLPTRWQAAFFLARAGVFQLRRALRDAARGRPPLLRREPLVRAGEAILAESHSLLAPSANPAEFVLQAGKTQNLRVAAARLHGLLIPRGASFSFWRHVGRPTRARGFVRGRELREGCIIPSVGGGLCQLSNPVSWRGQVSRPGWWMPGSRSTECGIDAIPAREDWQGVGLIVLPAWVEHQPRRLLRTVAAGLPVIASEACGLAGVAGVTVVPTGDTDALARELRRFSEQVPGR